MGPLIFALMLIVFLLSPVRQVTDSRYSMLLTQSILERGSFRLDDYGLPRHEPEWDKTFYRYGDYRLEASRGHVYYYLPPGSSVLSAPFVALLNAFGLSAVGDDDTYDNQGEVKIEATLTAFLMAALSCLFFYTARLILPIKWSVFVALCGALGTQVYSTASRAMWSHTWGILLLGIVVFLLLRLEARQRSFSPVLMASLLSWLYFVRPTFAVSILAISVYLFLFQRRLFPRYAVTGALWLAVFVLYSWTHFGQLLPSYYLVSRLEPDNFPEALAANLISPSRGLLIYVPALLFVAFLLVRYRHQLVHRRLVRLSLVVIVADMSVVSAFPQWWAGHCFGPRFMTGSVPWFVLLGALALRASLKWRGARAANSLASWRAQFAFGIALPVLSVFINANGAIQQATWEWNEGPPINVDLYPERVWDWGQPQFLAGYLSTPRRAYSPLEIWQGVGGDDAGCRQVKQGGLSSGFTSRPKFANAYPQSLTPEAFVDALNANSGGALSQAETNSLNSELKSGVKTRAQALRAVAEDADMQRQEFNRAFVLMQFFAYFRRDPDTGPDTDFSGYNFWLNKLNEFGGDHSRAEMTRAFIQSVEYGKRCGQ